MNKDRCRLYLISPPKIDLPKFIDQFQQACDGGEVAALQLRLKDVEDLEILRAAEQLVPLCREREIAFIMNDSAVLAKKLGADGVHLGQEDLEKTSIADARKLLGPDAQIGVSCHASKHLAMEAGEAGADYVAFGAFYPTQTKPPEKLAKWGTPKPEILEWWYENTVIPSVAIGGINLENAKTLVDAGADFLAVITAVWNHPVSPKAAVAAFNKVMAEK